MRKPALICLLIALAVGAAIYANWKKRNPETPPDNGKPVSGNPFLQWVEFRADNSRVRDFKISLPRSWTLDRRPIGTGAGGVAFFGPEEDGFKPNVHLYWGTKKQSVDETIHSTRRKYTAPPRSTKLLVDKPSNVAGMRGRHFVFPIQDRKTMYSTFVWVFGDPQLGHGELKGVCRSRDTVLYRQLFEEAARRLRWAPR